MRHYRLFAFVVAAVVLAGCVTPPKKVEKAVGINNSDVYRLAQEALQPVADQFIDRGDRILLVNARSFYGSDGWRFVPTPTEIPQDAFENVIRPAAQKAFASDSPEMKLLSTAFKLDSGDKVYALKTGDETYSDLLLGRILFTAGWSGVEKFSIDDFTHSNPYFIDSFEGGLLNAVLKKQARGFERLEVAGMSQADLVASIRKNMEDHQIGKLVFNTNMLSFTTWADIQAKYKPNTINKLLMYSVDNVIAEGTDWIGMQASFRLVDVAKGGKLLWAGTKTMTSSKYPKEKIPYLGALRLTIPTQIATTLRDSFAKALKDEGVRFPMSAVLVKIDDIPVVGSYPVTREDFAVENALQGMFASITGLNVVEKMYTRQYKEPWQMAHAVHYTNPLLSGDYTQFQSYYGAQYMIGYRILWSKIQGVQIMKTGDDLELADKILGIYVKVIDMADNGRIVLSDFMPFAGESDMVQSILYRCYSRTKGLTTLASSLRDTGVVLDSTATTLINRRMEITNNYIGEKTRSEGFIVKRMPPGKDQKALMNAYYDAYEVLRTFGVKKTEEKNSSSTDETATETPLTEAEELNLLVAVNLMQSWFEDGLTTALVKGGVAPNEKLESLYSRFLLTKSLGVGPSEELLYLSPLLLSQWGATWKGYYNIDKIIYFSLLETGKPTSQYVQVPATSPLARFFPFVAFDPDSLQVSVVNVTTGDYEYKQDLAVK
jgi:hypothetical protein